MKRATGSFISLGAAVALVFAVAASSASASKADNIVRIATQQTIANIDPYYN